MNATFGEQLFAAFEERRKAGPIAKDEWIAVANSVFDAQETAKRIPTLAEWLGYCATQYPLWPKTDATKAWQHYESLGWTKGKTPIRKWKMCVSTCYQNHIERNVTPQQAPRRKEAWELAIEQAARNDQTR